ncbi:chromosome alignment-maintaining phosphoprotein 1-like isoform X2 [Hyaena hyaena]|uniref:chromosome alignment-maintaining phosphoprotein 1-like isoform X2 n=1 Tax=Hyaena hyaena TaxID=95912 RepID=UPI001923B2F3|nr:chromosome alignment-maintaining phosphoprotein 1-like isoform X2 [Hyaena hyaena]
MGLGSLPWRLPLFPLVEGHPVFQGGQEICDPMDSDTSPGALERSTHKHKTSVSFPAAPTPRKLAVWTSPSPSVCSPGSWASGLQVLDPCDGESWEDPPGRSAYSFGTCCPGDVTCAVPSHALNPESPEVHVEDPLSSGAPDLLREAASGVPASPEAEDVDMPPAEPGGGRPRLSGAPEDWRMAEEWPTAAGPPVPATEPAEPGRPTPGRTPGSRPPPRLRSEKDRGPKLTVSKRKLELLLAEPEKSKRKRRCAAQTQGMN